MYVVGGCYDFPCLFQGLPGASLVGIGTAAPPHDGCVYPDVLRFCPRVLCCRNGCFRSGSSTSAGQVPGWRVGIFCCVCHVRRWNARESEESVKGAGNLTSAHVCCMRAPASSKEHLPSQQARQRETQTEGGEVRYPHLYLDKARQSTG